MREAKNYKENIVNKVPRYTREFDEATIPLVLIEAGFISNATKVKTIKNAYLMAKGIIHTYIQMYHDYQMITWFKIGKAFYIDNLVETPLISAPVIKNSRSFIGLSDLTTIFGGVVFFIPVTKEIVLLRY